MAFQIPCYLCLVLTLLTTCRSVAVDQQQLQDEQQQEQDDRSLFSLNEMAIIGGLRVRGPRFSFFVQGDGCGASLIARDVVMTAAHCLGAFSDKVLVGAVKEDYAEKGDAQWRNVVSNMVVHPDYDTSTHNNDIMLFKIEKVTKDHLLPILLNGEGPGFPLPDKPLKVVGMGSLDVAGEQYSPHLRHVNVNVVSHATCNDRYGGIIQETTMICAADFTHNKDSCYGDSGGPLFTLSDPPVQVGIVSFGADCADDYYPGVYSRVSGNMRWIKQEMCRLTDTNHGLCGGIRRKPGFNQD